MKTVYADLLGRVGFRVRQLLEHPPDGFRFVSRTQWSDQLSDRVIRNDFLWRWRHRLNRLAPLNLAAAYGLLRFKRPPADADLTYSESPLIFRREPWVVGVEVAIQFAGYDHRHLARYRQVVEAALGSRYCRGIICWSEAARRSLLERLSGEKFSEKISVLHPAGTPKPFARPASSNGRPVRILFVSSVVTPGGFEQKGGREVLEAFIWLRRINPQVELVVRSDVPEALRSGYEGAPGLKFVTQPVARAELDRLYQSADIFWYPAHSLSSVVVLEAMSYSLPVVTSDYYDNPEYIEDGRTGFVARHGRALPPWDTSPRDVLEAVREPDRGLVGELVEKTRLLVERPALRRQMGAAARAEVESGQFSLAVKNRKLQEVFERALAAEGVAA
jgi:glycosyltransferase involved in cell wall biosynthesis